MIYIKNDFFTWLELSLVGSLYTEFRVGTDISTAIVVDWGDGSTSSYSGTLMTISHTYSSAFTGNIKVSCSDGNSVINRIDGFSSTNTLNSIAFSTTQLGTFLGLEQFNCTESNIISGDITNLPNSLTSFSLSGSNTTSGNILNLPVGLTYFYVNGSNIITGNIANLPPSLIYCYIEGNNTTSGNISTLPSTIVEFRNKGLNTTTGSISTLSSGLRYYDNHGNNTTSGDIATLPAIMETFSNGGSNTTSGNISALPITVNYYVNTGQNTVVTYVSGRVWANPMRTFINLPTLASGGLSANEIDNILIDLSTPSWTLVDVLDTKTVNIAGNNAARTSASDAAVTTLISKGVTVITN
jgi:hypothetical protein